jgi:hypothetical protein
MTNLVFIERKSIAKQQERVLKRDIKQYAISLALKFPTKSISEQQKIRIAKFSVRSLLKRFDLSTKNLGVLIHDEVIGNLQKLYFKLKKKMLNYHFLSKSNKELLEMIKIVRLLQKNYPRKYRKLYKSLQRQLSKRQETIFNLYLNFKPRGRRRILTYRTVSRLSKTSPGTVTGDVKRVVQSLSKIFKTEGIKHVR